MTRGGGVITGMAMGKEFFRSFAYAQDKSTPVVDVRAWQK